MRFSPLHYNGDNFRIKIACSFFYYDVLLLFLELFGGPLGHKYKLEQFHCHWGCTSSKGSEHTVDGMPYAGEVSGF